MARGEPGGDNIASVSGVADVMGKARLEAGDALAQNGQAGIQEATNQVKGYLIRVRT